MSVDDDIYSTFLCLILSTVLGPYVKALGLPTENDVA